MTTLSTYANVKAECNLPETIKDVMINPHIESAAIEIRRLLGNDLYEVIRAEDAAEQRRIECVKGESILAFAYAVPFLNIETSGRGIVSAKGWDSNRSELMSVNESEKLVANLREQAMNLLSAHIPKPVDNAMTKEDESIPLDVQAGGITFIGI